MSELQNSKPYDLEKRTLQFAKDTRSFFKKLPRTITSVEDGKQVIRSTGSVGANYIEANESLSKKDFVMRIMICRKEAKESEYWFQLVECVDPDLENERLKLIREATELRKIFGAILEKSK